MRPAREPRIQLLLIDADTGFRQALSELLIEAGYDVREAKDEEDAQWLLRGSERRTVLLLGMTTGERSGEHRPPEDLPVVRFAKPVDLRELLRGIRQYASPR